MVEGQIGRFKQVIGPMLRFHTAAAQAIEIAIAVEAPNRMLDLGRPPLRPGRVTISREEGSSLPSGPPCNTLRHGVMDDAMVEPAAYVLQVAA